MDRELARKLLLLVNNLEVASALQEYVDSRLALLRGQLETAKEHSLILEIQGKIAELKRFSTLRDEVLQHKDT